MSKKIKKSKETMFFKYNQDDILEILTEYLAVENGFGTFSSKAVILGKPGEDLRLIAVVGDSENDLKEYKLEDIDKSMNFNGDHSGEIYESSVISITDGINKKD